MSKSYFELLRDPRWQKKRLEVMNRASFTCEECGATDITLNVHHKIYRKGAKPWQYEEHELACLCEDCHGRVSVTQGLLKEAMAVLNSGQLEQLLGYARGMRTVDFSRDHFPDSPGFVTSADAWQGIADACGFQRAFAGELGSLCSDSTTELDVFRAWKAILDEQADARERARARAAATEVASMN